MQGNEDNMLDSLVMGGYDKIGELFEGNGDSSDELDRLSEDMKNAESINDVPEVSDKKVVAQPVVIGRKQFGEIVYQNMINTSGRIYSGKEKRRLRRECERNAIAGKYDHIFSEAALERRRKNFENLNKS